MLSIYLVCLGVILVYQSLWYVVSVVKKNSSVADISWGLGFILVAFLSWYLSKNWDERNVLVISLVSLWGIRLATHIAVRNWNKTEDSRYKKWRDGWGASWIWRSYFQVFILQGFLLTIISLPVLWVNLYSISFGSWTDYLGLMLWIVGFVFETVGDYQLMVFKNDALNKNKILDTGLWRYTRHPNYFGEATMWWGIWLIVISSSPNPLKYLTIIGPLTITFLLLKVSGVTLTEKRFEGSEQYIRYQRTTSSFIPWIPKNRFW